MITKQEIIEDLEQLKLYARQDEERIRRERATVLDVTRNLTATEDAVYWAAFYAGRSDAFSRAVQQVQAIDSL